MITRKNSFKTNRLMGINKISGSLPSSISKLTSLTSLSLPSNNIISTLPDFSQMQLLTTLILNTNQFYGSIPGAVFNLPAIQTINLSFNNLTGFIPSFPASNKLTQLALNHNQLSGTIPPSISQLTQLQGSFLFDPSRFLSHVFFTSLCESQFCSLIPMAFLVVFLTWLL